MFYSKNRGGAMQGKTRFWGSILFLMFVSLVMAQGHGDPIDISSAPGYQSFPQLEYDPIHGQYFLVWEEMDLNYQTDIYGQFLAEDGSALGEVFVVCETDGNQWWPRLAFDPLNERFLVVFEDNRNGDDQGDIRGILVASDGSFVDAPTSEADHTFGICTEAHDIYACSVAFNFKDNVYLAVWGDNRVAGDQTGEMWGQDIYGQLIADDGSLILPEDPTVNFPVDQAEWYEASVPDVTYNSITNEFFVAYGISTSTSIGYVLGQRVNSNAELVNPDGSVGIGKTSSVVPAMFISETHNNGPDCLQARVASRTGYRAAMGKSDAVLPTEVQVVWKGMKDQTQNAYYNDIYGQRVGFVLEDGIYVAKYINLAGEITDDVSNFAISLQPGWASPPELAYNEYDDEFLVAWGDPRDEETRDDDMYMQRLWINEQEEMIFLADDRINTVTNTENILLAGTHIEERSPAGIAYSNHINHYMVVYQKGAYDSENHFDLQGNMVYGSALPVAASIRISPDDASVSPGGTQPFTCQVFDADGNELDFSVNWSCTGGSIDAFGLYKAGATSGSYTVTAEEPNSGVTQSVTVAIQGLTQVPELKGFPVKYALKQNYPNPFNPDTEIQFYVKESGQVVLKIYNIHGDEVATLVNGKLAAGAYQVRFRADYLSTGVYFYRMQVNDFVDVRKMVLME